MKQKHIIIKDTFVYSGASYIVIIVGFIVSVFSKKLLGVSGAGYWALLTVITTYGMFINLGIGTALVREVPQRMGAGETEKAKMIVDVTFSYLIVAGLVVAVVIWLLSFFLFTDPLLKTGMKIIAVLVPMTLMYNLVINVLRAKKQISILSKVIIINILFIAMFAIPGAYLFNVNGFAAGTVIATALSFCLAKRWSNIRFSLSFDWDQIWHLIKIGFAMFLASILFRTFLNVDKIMIGKILGIEQLGLYTIGIMAVQQVGSLPRFFNIVIFPHIQEKYGATKDVMDVKEMILRPTYFISRLMPILMGIIIFLAQPIVLYVLPQFKDGLGVMKILVLGYFFMAVNQMSSVLLFTIDKQKLLIPLYGIMVAVCIGFNYLFITMGLGIIGVALGTSISYFLFFLVVFPFASKHIIEWREIKRFYFEIMIFYIYFLTNILWIDAVVNFPGAILTSFAKISCFLLVCIPVLISVQRRERIFSLIFKMVRSKIFSSPS
jgi:O-antigen/teichoic acid export membrane protein